MTRSHPILRKVAIDKEAIRGWRLRTHNIIFEADTPAGRWFDVLLIVWIFISVFVVMLDSVASIKSAYGGLLNGIEWFCTVLFTIEYLLRLLCIGQPIKYATSYYGIVDLLAIVPTYLSLILPGSHYLIVIRILRVLRIFRVLKLAQYLGEANLLMSALRASRRKIVVFLFAVMSLVVIIGAIMYLVEGEENGFTSIPHSVYWAIVTLTTVGYGDISPQTGFGRAVACFVMILGYGIIAVPTGIVTAELTFASGRRLSTQVCPQCASEGHDADAVYCKNCGSKL
ncbi:MAG: ion transporter [bacterium]